VTTTDHRPPPVQDTPPPPRIKVKLPSRDDNGELILPPSAVSFAWIYAGPNGATVKAKGTPVPVNDAGARTHLEWECPQCPGSAQWISANAKAQPICSRCRNRLVRAGRRRMPAVPWARIGRSQRERLQAAAATGAVLAAGTVADVADLPWYGDAAQLAAVPACIAGSWWLTRVYFTRRAVKAGRVDLRDEVAGKRARKLIARRGRLAAYIAAAASMWVEVADVVNLDPATADGAAALLALAGIGVVGSRPYRAWADDRARRARAPRDEPAPGVDPVPAGARRDAADWAATVATGTLPGTAVDVSTWQTDEGGRRMVIRNSGRRAALTDEKLRMALPLVAGAFDVPLSAIGWVPEHEESPNAALLLVQPNSPLNDIVKGEPIDVVPVERAVAHMGRRIDGTPLQTRLFTPGWGAPSRVIIGTKGSGKALALDTPVPTPNGWTTMGEIRTGDRVFDENGQVCTVTLAAEIMYGRPCYEVEFSDGTVIVADEQHRWKTTTLRGRWQQANHARPSRAKAQRLRDSGWSTEGPRLAMRTMHDVEPVTTEQIAATLKVDLGGNAGLCSNHAIDNCGPLEYPKRDLPIAPYTLGAWLGDGRTDYASIASDDDEILEQIRLDGYEITRQAEPFMYGIRNRHDRNRRIAEARALIAQGWSVSAAERHTGLPRSAVAGAAGSELPEVVSPADPQERHQTMTELFRNLGVFGNKHIPDAYLRGSVDQRRALLAGLMDTDGTCEKSGQSVFAVTSERLARDTYELVTGLGFKATIRTKRVKGRTEASSTCYMVAFTAHEPVFRLRRKLDRQRPVAETSTSRRRYIVDVRPVESVPVRCIAVDSPSHLFLASKACIATHNTETIRRLILAMLCARIDGLQGPKRLVAPFLHDPKRGADYGAYRRQVCGFSIGSDTLHMIVEGFAREMDRRYDALASTVWIDAKGREREGERPFDPYTMGPVLSLMLDEFHIDAKDTALMAKLEPFGRKMRAAGIEVNLATHLSTIGDTGSQGFRDMCAGGEAWLLRTTLGLNAALATGGTLNGDPRLLPRVPGMVLQSSGEDVTMQARVAYDDPETLYDLLYDDDNESRIQPIEWPQETLDAFGPDLVAWMQASQGRQVGTAATSAPVGYRPSGQPDGSAEDRGALDVLAQVLLKRGGPARRGDIMTDSLWTWTMKTLSNCLRSGQDVNPAIIRKADGPSGAYVLTPYGVEWARLIGDRRQEDTDAAAAETSE
jgi:hypothetical protein